MNTALDDIAQGFCLNLQTYAPKYAIFNSIIQIFGTNLVLKCLGVRNPGVIFGFG